MEKSINSPLRKICNRTEQHRKRERKVRGEKMSGENECHEKWRKIKIFPFLLFFHQ